MTLTWGGIEAQTRSAAGDTGYSLDVCDRWWILIAKPSAPDLSAGYAYFVKTVGGGWLFEGYIRYHLGPDVLVFPHFAAARTEAQIIRAEGSPLILGVWPLGLGDFFRLGRSPIGRIKYNASLVAIRHCLGLDLTPNGTKASPGRRR